MRDGTKQVAFGVFAVAPKDPRARRVMSLRVCVASLRVDSEVAAAYIIAIVPAVAACLAVTAVMRQNYISFPLRRSRRLAIPGTHCLHRWD